MTSTPVKFEQLPIRGAALKSILKTIDPEKAKAEEKEKIARELALQTPKRKATPCKGTPKKAATPKKVIVYDSTPPSSPEPAKKGRTPRKAGGQESRDLSQLLDKELGLKRKYVRKLSKKRGKEATSSDESAKEEEPRRELLWYDGDVTPDDLDFKKLNFKLNFYFIGKYKLLHLVSLDESMGATYIVYRNKYELVLRVNFIQKDDMEQLNTELKFLEMMELNTAQHYFATIYDVGYVNKHEAGGWNYYTYIYRGGPTLQQCLSICKGKVSAESVDRLAGQVVKIFEQLCGQGYRLVAFSLDDFTIDARSRIVFLNKFNNIVKVFGFDLHDDEEEVVDITMPNEHRRIAWEGHPDFAPIMWHQKGEAHMMTERDSIESLIYMLIHMHTGSLPWADKEEKEALKVFHSDPKERGALIHSLPPSLMCMWTMIRSWEVPDVNFPRIHRMFTKYFDDDEEFVYDWESSTEPSEDQLSLLRMKQNIEDMQKKMAVMQCIFDNEELLARR